MSTPLQRKNPTRARCGAGKNETRTALQYLVKPVTVKRLADTEMVCGLCHYYREGRRKFCAFLGETVRAGGACKVDPQIQAVMP